MKIYSLDESQLVHASMEDCWDFFSQPKNLQTITPAYMNFNIIQGAAERMYNGQIIEYTVSPVLGIKMGWVTEIKNVIDHSLFVDEQRFGPYKLWHHKHFFESHPEGVMMRDLVHYALPMGILGRIGHSLFVKKQLKGIFDYRRKKVDELFNNKK